MSAGVRIRDLILEAKRRRVFRVGVAYALVAFIVAQVVNNFFPALGFEPWAQHFVIVLLVLGMPVAIALAWAFDITPQGIERASAPPRPAAGRQPAQGPPGGGAPDRDRWARVQEILVAALELPPAQRAAYLDRTCGTDPMLRGEVESLIRAHEVSGPLDRLSDAVAPVVEPLRDARARSRSSEAPSPRGGADSARHALAGRYEIGEKLGGGGMGIVYRAHDLRLARTVALKFLPTELSSDPEAKRRFLFEARAAAGLDHPNICTIHEIGETDDGRLFIAMPLYDGRTLKARLARGRVALEEALDIATQVARGLAKAHEAGIVHRDIKPANVMLTDEGVVKILDFGIAKATGATVTAAGAVVGTAAYMSPEQARGESVDDRADLWSLGVVLFEMLTGERLFRGTEPDAILAEIRSEEPVRLGRLRGTAPAPVIRLLERLLAKPPDARTPAATTLIRHLQEAGEAPVEEVEPAEEVSLTPEGERRQVALVSGLFFGSASLVERLAPADLDARLARLRAGLADVVDEHGGSLNEFTGERFVAVFGVPRAHEDDLPRAIRAALALRSLPELGAEEGGDDSLAVQTGIAVGTVVAQRLDGGERPYRITGAVTQTAARLAAHAEPGEIVLDAGCERIAREHAHIEGREPVPGPPGGEPLRAYRVLGEADGTGRLEATDPDRLTAYAGRERELATLQSGLEQALAGEGQVITVVGEAGVGKSRLLYEFRRRLEPGTVRVIRGHCQAGTGQKPYAPFVEALLELLGVARDVPPKEMEERLAAEVRGIATELEDFLPFYFHLLNLPSTRHPLPRHLKGEQFRAAMREALTALLTLAAAQPVALLLEDWHWADDASDEVLKQLADMVPAYQLLVVVTYRPGDRAEWSSSLRRTLVHLAPLTPAESALIIRSVLGATDLAGDVVSALHERSGGNPFFLEELCLALGEHRLLQVEGDRVRLAGAPDELHLPNTIQGLIRTRLDRLPPEAGEVLRAAAVIGRQFSLPVLERMGLDAGPVRHALDRLKTMGIVQPVRLVPEPVYRFKHVLTQEVAYDTLLLHQRRAQHARAGRALEELYPERREQLADRLAHHFSRAEEWRKAVHYGRASARRARELSEFPQALAILEQVETWLAKLPPDRNRQETEIEILLEQEQICETMGMRARQQETITRVLQSLGADPAPDPVRLAEVHRRQGDVHTLMGRFTDARAALETASRFARESADVNPQVAVLRSLGLMCWHEGHHGEALGHLREALRIDREREDPEAVMGDLHNIAQILKSDGDLDGALSALNEALELAGDPAHEVKKAHILYNIANVHRARGDSAEALENLMAAAELARKRHLPVHLCFHLTAIAHIHLTEGRIEESLRYYMEAVDVTRRARYTEGLALSLKILGEVLAGVGRDSEGLPYLCEAAELYSQLGDAVSELDLWRKAASTHERHGDLRRALEAWRHVDELADGTDDQGTRIQSLEGIARCLREIDAEPGAALPSLESALGIARLVGDARAEARILNSLGIVEWTRGEHEAALGHYEAALEVFRSLDDPIHMGLVLNSLGVTLKALGRSEAARARLEEAVALNRRTGERLLEGHGLAALGELYEETGDPDEARRCFEASLQIRREIGDRRGESWMLHALARSHSRAGDTGTAREYLAAAREIAAEREDVELLRACAEIPT